MMEKHNEARDRALRLMEQMTFEEKIMQMIQIAYTSETPELAKKGVGSVINAYGSDAMEIQKEAVEKSRLGIPILFSIDCIHGHALNPMATIFPNQLAMAQSFNPEAVRTCGEVSAREVLADGIRFVLSPVLDVARDLRWGRISETFGEDPFLNGELGSAMVEGYESEIAGGKKVICCPKHFIAYSESIGGRDSSEVSVSDRKVKQFYMPVFEKALKAGCGAIMSGQHVHDGKPMCVNGHLIQGFLKQDAGFSGFVITDNNSSKQPFRRGVVKTEAESFREAVLAGNDMLMFCAKDTSFRELALAYEHDEEFIARVDDAVLRILSAKFEIGLFDDPYFQLPKSEFCSDENFEQLVEVTRQSMTLLENNGVLPIDAEKVKKIAVIGPAADNAYSQYGDWTYLNMPFSKVGHQDITGKQTSYLTGIQAEAQQHGIEVLYEQGCDFISKEESRIQNAVDVARGSDLVILCLGDMNRQNGEHYDRAHLELSGLQNELYAAIRSLQIPIVVILSNGRPLLMNEIFDTADAILECFNSGLAGGQVVAEILFGNVNPSGRLPISIPRCEGQLPIYYNHLPGWQNLQYVDEEATPRYSFGYGLSYTSFAYSDFRVWHEEDELRASVKITNTGDRDGVEVPQLYVRIANASYIQPVKSLKAFKRVELEAKESKVVSFAVDKKELEIVGKDCISRFEGGTFEVMIGKSSSDIYESQSIVMEA